MNRTKYIAYTSLFLALATVATLAIAIPMPNSNGYINAGDAVIFICAVFMGPFSGLIVGGIGSMLADIFLGYAVWAPASLIIKGLEGFVCGLVFKVIEKRAKRRSVLNYFIPMLAGGLIMLVGYFFATWIITSSVTVAGLSTIENSIQIAVSIALACVICFTFTAIVKRRKK